MQSLSDRNFNYHGSDRMFYLGSTIGSSSTWAFVALSGTNTGFGNHSDEESNRFQIVSSGTSFIQWSWNSGLTLGGELWGGDSITQDGVTRSGVWMRSNAASQGYQLWFW